MPMPPLRPSNHILPPRHALQVKPDTQVVGARVRAGGEREEELGQAGDDGAREAPVAVVDGEEEGRLAEEDEESVVVEGVAGLGDGGEADGAVLFADDDGLGEDVVPDFVAELGWEGEEARGLGYCGWRCGRVLGLWGGCRLFRG